MNAMSIAAERARLILAEDWQHPVLRSSMEQLVADNERLEQHVNDLQSGMYVNCVYCGHQYGPGEVTPVTMADALKAHIAQCPEHPMAKLVDVLKGASHALKSYACGNASPDLAQSVADACDAAIARAIGAR